MEPTKPKPILVLVDFSAESRAALLHTCDLPALEQSPLVVLHVTQDSARSADMYRRQAEKAPLLPMHEIAERAMQDFINGMREEHPDLDALQSARTMVVDGIPTTRVLEVAQKLNAGQIMLGGHERGYLSRLLNGSVAEALTNKSRIPVTVYKSDHAEEYADIKKQAGDMRGSATQYLVEVEKSAAVLATEIKHFFEHMAKRVGTAAKSTASAPSKHLSRVVDEVKEAGEASIRVLGENFDQLRRHILELTPATVKKVEKPKRKGRDKSENKQKVRAIKSKKKAAVRNKRTVKETAKTPPSDKKKTSKKPAVSKKTAPTRTAKTREVRKTARKKPTARKNVTEKVDGKGGGV